MHFFPGGERTIAESRPQLSKQKSSPTIDIMGCGYGHLLCCNLFFTPVSNDIKDVFENHFSDTIAIPC